jgi:hypothetical protein
LSLAIGRIVDRPNVPCSVQAAGGADIVASPNGGLPSYSISRCSQRPCFKILKLGLRTRRQRSSANFRRQLRRH